MAGGYVIPDAEDVDFTLRQEPARQPEGLDIVVNGDERLKRLTDPGNDSADLQLQETTVDTNDSTNFTLAASDILFYEPPGQNNVNYTINTYTAPGQNNVNYVVGEDTTPEIYQPPAYSAPASDNLLFSLRSYESSASNDLYIRLSEAATVEEGIPVSELSATTTSESTEQSSHTVAELSSTATALDATEQSHTQQPLSAILASLTAEQSDTVQAAVANTVFGLDYRRSLFLATVDNTVETLDAEAEDNELAEAAASITPYTAENGQYVLNSIDPATSILSLTADYTIERESRTIAELSPQALSLLRGDSPDKELAEIRTETITEDLFRVAPEYPFMELQANIQSLDPQQGTITQGVVPVNVQDLSSPPSEVSISPVIDLVNTLEAEQFEYTRIDVRNRIQGLETEEAERFPQSPVTSQVPTLEYEQSSFNIISVVSQNSILDYEQSSNNIAQVSEEVTFYGYQRPEYPLSQAQVEATSEPTVTNGEYNRVFAFGDTFGIAEVIQNHAISPLMADASSEGYQTPEYPISLIGIITTNYDLPLSDYTQGYAQVTAVSFPIQNDEYAIGLAASSIDDGGYSIPEYTVQEAFATGSSYSPQNSQYDIGFELTVQTDIFGFVWENEFEILFIPAPIETGLEYFERDDISGGDRGSRPGLSATNFGGGIALLKSGGKTIVLS